MKKVLLVATATVVSAIAASNALASNALTIFNTPASTPVTYDNASGAYPIINAILSQPGTVNGFTFTAWSFPAVDSTGSIIMYGAMPASSSYVPTVGDAISVQGTYSPYHQIPEIGTLTAITQMSSGHAAPPPSVFTIADMIASTTIPQNMAGHLVEVTNVMLYTDAAATIPVAGNFPAANTALYAKDSAGNVMEVYVWMTSYSTCAAFAGTPEPAGRVNIVGILSQSGTFPVELTPISFIPLGPQIDYTNILSNLVRPGDDPTNTVFTEYALRPGETLTINTRAYDIDGSNVTIYASSTTPSGGWSSATASGTSVPDTFSYTPASGDAGNAYQVSLQAGTAHGTNTTTWSIYVPTAQEQNIVISEFLANPTSDTNSLYWNPLHRPAPGSANAFADDEFIEIVNNNNTSMDMIGWGFRDSTALRHEFYSSFPVDPTSAFVLYGGQLNSDPVPPVLPCPSAAFSESSSAVSVLNDSGDTISLYKDLDTTPRLIARVVYTKKTSANGISWTRWPGLNDGFVEHNSVVATNASPGLQPDQRTFSQPVLIVSPPTVSHLADQTIRQDTTTGPVAFTVGDPVDPATSLTVAAQSGNPILIPNGNIVFGGSGASRTVTVTPASGQSGIVMLALTIANTHLRCVNTNLTIIVTPTNKPPSLFCDDFTYADGSLITNSGFVWTNHSGTVGEMQVTNGTLEVTYHQSEDVHRVIDGGPYAPGGVPIYYAFDVKFTELPNSVGSYFAHLNTNTSYFHARLTAETANAAAGKFRLAIGNGASGEVQFPQDLDTNITYRVVVRHDMVDGTSTLWVNPTWEGSTSVDSTDGTSPASVGEMCFRQAAGIGTMFIDNLCVGTSFTAVDGVPAIPLTATRNPGNLILSWDNPAFRLFTGTNITQITNMVTGLTTSYTNSSTTSRYYKLIWP
jgi:Lamin Tail Domain